MGDRKSLVLAQGMDGIMENAFLNVKNTSLSISADLDLNGNITLEDYNSTSNNYDLTINLIKGIEIRDLYWFSYVNRTYHNPTANWTFEPSIGPQKTKTNATNIFGAWYRHNLVVNQLDGAIECNLVFGREVVFFHLH